MLDPAAEGRGNRVWYYTCGCRCGGAPRVFSHYAFTGISRRHLHLLVVELRPAWSAAREGRLHARRGAHRRRAAGAGRGCGSPTGWW